MNTLVMLQGGHTTLIRNSEPKELAEILDTYRAEPSPQPLLYLQETQHGDDGLILDPLAVVALIASP